jgi:hypothetical protein
MKLPVPTTSIGARASAVTRHFSTPKPEDAAIFAAGHRHQTVTSLLAIPLLIAVCC